MDLSELLEGYRRILRTIYSPKAYYQRVLNFLLSYRPLHLCKQRIQLTELYALAKSMFVLGVAEKERMCYWRLFFWSLFHKPQQFPTAMTFAIYGFHFRRVFRQYF
jgi:hypothetical protein